MIKNILKFTVISALVGLLGLSFFFINQTYPVFANDLGQGRGPGYGGGNGQGQNTPAGSGRGSSTTPLSEPEKNGLSRAILEEYGALNLYQSVIKQFGEVSPFSQIARSEQQHVNALTRQAEKYGAPVPGNPGLTNPPVFSTLQEACEAGVIAEKTDAALYDQLKPSVTHTDILNVFTNLQNASLNSHLPAFQVCQ